MPAILSDIQIQQTKIVIVTIRLPSIMVYIKRKNRKRKKRLKGERLRGLPSVMINKQDNGF